MKEELDDSDAEMGYSDQDGFEDGTEMRDDDSDDFLDPVLCRGIVLMDDEGFSLCGSDDEGDAE
jgi:hypothetical protein